MKKKTLWKDIKRCFLKSKGRFFSIVCLVALGSFALVGLQIAGPDMRKTGENYFNRLHLSDISVIGGYGIDEANQGAINKVSGAAQIDYGYLKDVVVTDSDTSIRVFSSTDGISEYEVISGRMPENEDEIAIASFLTDDYKLGDTISFTEKTDISGDTILKNHDFQIVGFVNSGELLSIINMGQSTAGTGELQGYAVVTPAAFDSEVYMIARILFDDTEGVDPYSAEYTKLIQSHKDELGLLLADQPDKRLDSIKSVYQEKINNAQLQIGDAKQELSEALTKLTDGEGKLTEAKQKYADGLAEYETQKADIEQQLKDAQQELASASEQISEGESEFWEKQQELSNAEGALQSARNTLDSKWAEYNEKRSQLEELKQMKLQLDAAQAELDAAAETATGMTITEIEAALPKMKERLDASETQYESLSQLAALKASRDAAAETPEYDALNAQYQAALMSAGLDETAADALYAQMGGMREQIVAAKKQYNQLCALVEAQNTLSEKRAAYNAAASQSAGAEEKLAAAETELNNGESEYSAKQGVIETARQQLAAAETTLANAKQEYEIGINKYNIKKAEANTGLADAKSKLDDAAVQIAASEKELADGWAEYNEKKPDADEKISDAEDKVAEAQDALNKLTSPVYALNTRREVPGSEGYRIYGNVSNIIDALADIFPIFLYFVAALVTLTTMTRFVDEERINSGTLKALGYSNKDIIKKFTVYGFAASMAGTILGIIAGHTLLPMIVYNAYGKSFTYPRIELHFYPVISLIALALAFLCAVIPAFIVAKRELQEKPSALLMPKPPEAGSKILLERIRPVWNRMSFTHKVTARNIFRYKKRMLMTVFGVCGAVTLIFSGFSVQHSISGIKDRQFTEIMKYDLIVAQNDGLNEKQQSEINHLLADESINSQIPIHYEAVTKIAGKNEDKQEIKLIVPEDAEGLAQYITLAERSSGKKIELADDGCVISERLAKLLNAGTGDSFEITDSEGNLQKLTVSDITEMYTGHFIFMNSTYYRTAFTEVYNTNANLITLNDRSMDNAKEQASRFMELDGVKGVVQNTTLTNQIDTIVHSLNKIMQILIIIAMLLAIVILYNLTNINVSERIRELSTIKVLGFFNKEVTMYIYRETIILTLLGILAGFGLGDVLYRYIISIVPPDEVMFNPALGLKAFLIPVIVISVITLLLGIMMNHRLKNVDMLEALKSVE